jgi:hypothetical protein
VAVSKKEKHEVEVIKPLDKDGAIVAIDSKLVKVKVHYRYKHASENDEVCEHGTLSQCLLCGSGTWAVMKFDDLEMHKRKDYKAVWKEVFFALKMNQNERDYVCENQSLQREFAGKKQPGCGECEKCKSRQLAWEVRQNAFASQKTFGCEPIQQDDNGDTPF